MLRSGNRRPNEEFDGPDDFDQQLGLKDLRAALAIDEPSIYADAEGNVIGVTFRRLAMEGYTPARLGPVTITLAGRKKSASVSVHFQSHEATVETWIRFKIGRVGDLVARAVSDHWAPWAIVKLIYTVTTSGSVTMTCFGSSVPSHSIYVDWQLEARYRMEERCTMAAFLKFMQTQWCRDAPITQLCRSERSCRIEPSLRVIGC